MRRRRILLTTSATVASSLRAGITTLIRCSPFASRRSAVDHCAASLVDSRNQAAAFGSMSGPQDVAGSWRSSSGSR